MINIPSVRIILFTLHPLASVKGAARAHNGPEARNEFLCRATLAAERTERERAPGGRPPVLQAAVRKKHRYRRERERESFSREIYYDGSASRSRRRRRRRQQQQRRRPHKSPEASSLVRNINKRPEGLRKGVFIVAEAGEINGGWSVMEAEREREREFSLYTAWKMARY